MHHNRAAVSTTTGQLRANGGARAWLRSRTAWLAGAGLLVAALGLRLYRLGAQSLWLDEGGTWAEITGRTGKGWPGLVAELWSPDAAYPIYHLLLKAWVGLAGDTEWALRLPSAIAGALAVVAVWLAAREILHAERSNAQGPDVRAIIAGLLLLTSPYALWHAQDAKTYSLLMLAIALLLWSFLRALRRDDSTAWLLTLGLALVSVFVHRLALLSLAGLALAYVIAWPRHDDGRRTAPRRAPLAVGQWSEVGGRSALAGLALLLAAFAIYGAIRAVGAESRGSGGHVAAGPLLGIWLTFAHFSLDRGNVDGFLGLPLLAWALPAGVLTVWGVVRLARDARRGSPGAITLLCALGVPLALLAAALAFAPIYEARYAMVAFPAWVLALAYPLVAVDESRQTIDDRVSGRSGAAYVDRRDRSILYRPSSIVYGILVAALLGANAAVLLQPEHGQFSGAPVKEQWREGVAAIARRAHPDDLLILHPYYADQMWAYYAPRVTPDPLPPPIAFTGFREGYAFEQLTDPRAIRERFRREYEPVFNASAYGKKRMLMLMAPEHARTIDPPKTREELEAERPGATFAEDDRYGWLGLRFQYADKQGTWPCGGASFVGVEVMCASFPETFNAGGPGSIPEPETPLHAVFGGELRLRGFTIAPAGGALRPGGTLPITLFWAAVRPPSHDYTMFLHLCRDCDVPPLAQDDRPPLNGYFPAGQTTTWRVDDPVHDERAVFLPPDLPPGRYTLLLGVYPAGNPAIAARLPVESDAPAPGGTRLVLADVDVTR